VGEKKAKKDREKGQMKEQRSRLEVLKMENDDAAL